MRMMRMIGNMKCFHKLIWALLIVHGKLDRHVWALGLYAGVLGTLYKKNY
jgi:hypothetical protein